MNIPVQPLGITDTWSHSAMGNAIFTEPRQGFLDPKLAQVFLNNKTIKPHISNSPPVGAIAGASVAGFILALLIIAFFLLRRRQRMMALSQPLSEPPPNLVELQGLQEDSLHELPSALIELDYSTPKSQ